MERTKADSIRLKKLDGILRLVIGLVALASFSFFLYLWMINMIQDHFRGLTFQRRSEEFVSNLVGLFFTTSGTLFGIFEVISSLLILGTNENTLGRWKLSARFKLLTWICLAVLFSSMAFFFGFFIFFVL